MKHYIFLLFLAPLFLFNCSDNHRSYLDNKAYEYRCLDLANNVDGLHLEGYTWTNDDYVVIDPRIKGPYMVFSEGDNNIALRNYGANVSYSYTKFEAYLDDAESLLGR